MELSDIVEHWSYWDKSIPDSVPREVELPITIDPKLAIVIQGVRRSGKSTLLTQFLGRYQLNPKKCLFVNFEDPRFVGHLNANTLDQLVQWFRVKNEKNDPLYFFFDEIQNVDHWQKWLHTQLERPSGNHFIVTGSNSELLSKELGTSLTGRHRSITLFPFSMQELASLKNNLTVEKYLALGGFPGAVQSNEPQVLLRQYFSDIIEKDVLARLGVSNPKAIRQVAKIVFESVGSELSFRKLAGAVGLSADTVANYIDYCESAYLFSSCPFFSFSEKQRVRRNSKYYAIDPALRRAVATPTGTDLGKDFELVVFLALKRIFGEVCYWKGKGEVDFVVQNQKGFWPIQVSIEEPKDRHHRALEEFYSQFTQAQPEVFITLDNFVDYIG